MVTIGMFAIEVLGYIIITRRFPVLPREDAGGPLRFFWREVITMSKRVTIDPVTRIEGHLRVDVEVEGGKVKKAWSSGQMWRGVENILIGRDPRDAWAITQRICGVHHGACDGFGACGRERPAARDPVNAQYIRNLIMLAHGRMITSSISTTCRPSTGSMWSAPPRPTRPRPPASRRASPAGRQQRAEFQKVQDKMKGYVATGQLGIFTNGYWGHPAMKLPPE